MRRRLARVVVLAPAVVVALALPASSRTGVAGQQALLACPDTVCNIDLSVTMTATPDVVPAGNELTYHLTVRNASGQSATDPADNVAVDQTFKDSDGALEDVTILSAKWATRSTPQNVTPCDTPNNVAKTVHCSLGHLENTNLESSGGPRDITVVVRPDPTSPPPDYPRTLHSEAVVGADCGCSEGFPNDNHDDHDTTVTSPGDIKLTKSHADPMPPSGPNDDPSYYQLRLENTADAATLPPFDDSGAPVDPPPLTVVDTLPHGFVFAGTQPDPANPSVKNVCSATDAGPLENSTVTCHPQVSIPPGGSYTIFLGVRPFQTGTFTNFAESRKYGGDITPGDDWASDLTHVVCPKPGTSRIPFLCVIKTDSQDPVPQGQPFNYLIKVQNTRAGEDREDFTGTVDVTDKIPPGMTVQSATVPNGSCSVTNGVLNCRLNPPIPGGGSRTITVTLIALEVGTFENVACIVNVRQPAAPCGNQPTTIISAADLAITKTGSPNPVEVNSDLTYTMKVTNKGPSSVPNVQFDDSIPANTTFVSSSVSPGGPSCGLQGTSNLHCDLGTMAASTSKTVTAVVRPLTPGPITNTAKVANDGSPQAPVDFDLTNNTASFTVDSRGADVTIAKTAAPTTVGVGQPLTYTVRVTNSGPGVASGVKMTDTLPGAVSSPTITTTKGSCSGTANITCTIGTMNPAEVVTITIRVTPNRPGSATNTARVQGDSFDTDTTNNQASATVSITASDVTISKTAGPNPVAVGTPLTYTLTVHNNGPNTASGVTVRDTFPDGVTLPTITPSQGTCLGSPAVTCTLGDLAANATATVSIVVTAPFAGDVTLTNSATVSSSFDLNPGNNDASVTTGVIEPKLELTPKLARTGFVTTATGTDFPANAPLELTWSRGLGKQTVTTGPDGTFTRQMLVFPNDQEGLRQLVATALQPQVPATNFLPATKLFLVVPNSSQPFQVKPLVPVTRIVARSG